MADWRSIKKIDSHVHILPKEVLDANLDCDDAVLTFAEQNGIPVAFHSYPNRLKKNVCAPNRIAHVLERHPDLIAIASHLGGFQWKDAVKLNAYFDISAILPDYVLKYGIEKCNRILRNFPVDRLFFATDWPCSRSCRTEEIYERYFGILDQMDFTETEAEQIAFGNIAALLWTVFPARASCSPVKQIFHSKTPDVKAF